MRVLTVLLAATLAGCHLATPYDPRPDQGPKDLGVRDRGAPDLPRPDLSRPDLPQPDMAQPDLTLPDLSLPDVAQPDLTLPDLSLPDVAQPDVAQPDLPPLDLPGPEFFIPGPDVMTMDTYAGPDSCVPQYGDLGLLGSCVDLEGAKSNQGNCTCKGIAGDVDCDGLINEPWHNKHNPLLMADGFVSDPAARWKMGKKATWDASKGHVRLTSGGRLGLQPGCTSLLKGSTDLLVMRFQVSALVNPTMFSLQLESSINGTIKRYCRVTSSGGASKAWTYLGHCEVGTKCYSGAGTSLTLHPGHWYVLQSWAEGSGAQHAHRCRLLSGDGVNVLSQAKLVGGKALPAGNVSVVANSINVELDHVRIYQTP